jgi:hypothetical protein
LIELSAPHVVGSALRTARVLFGGVADADGERGLGEPARLFGGHGRRPDRSDRRDG